MSLTGRGGGLNEDIPGRWDHKACSVHSVSDVSGMVCWGVLARVLLSVGMYCPNVNV